MEDKIVTIEEGAFGWVKDSLPHDELAVLVTALVKETVRSILENTTVIISRHDGEWRIVFGSEMLDEFTVSFSLSEHVQDAFGFVDTQEAYDSLIEALLPEAERSDGA